MVWRFCTKHDHDKYIYHIVWKDRLYSKKKGVICSIVNEVLQTKWNLSSFNVIFSHWNVNVYINGDKITPIGYQLFSREHPKNLLAYCIGENKNAADVGYWHSLTNSFVVLTDTQAIWKQYQEAVPAPLTNQWAKVHDAFNIWFGLGQLSI